VAGNDRASFLQGLLTNDIQALKPGEGCYAAWLTPQGRMLTDMHVLESDGMMLLDVPAAQADATLGPARTVSVLRRT
jgi:folate-binding Fe-S cluster repair protein YgfZ